MILVLGAAGQVGSAIMAVLGPSAIGWTRADIDLGDRAAIGPMILSEKPTAIVNCAAYTDVDAAEGDEAMARAVNGEAVGAMARAGRELGVPFVTLSTDYVFNGNQRRPYVESDTPNPLNVYGASKLLGERNALEVYPEACIVRTSWVFSATHRCFVTAIGDKMLSGESVTVVADQIGTPTSALALAAVVASLAEEPVPGVLHVAGPNVMSWYDLARVIAVEIGRNPAEAVTPCSSDAFPSVAKRPAYSALASERRPDVRLPDTTESIAEAISVLRTR